MVVWQSSQRPMYVRTVWVDGFRHAILTHDDPHYLKLSAKKRRPNSSSSTDQPTGHSRDHEGCIKVSLVVHSGKSVLAKRPKSSNDSLVEKLNLSEIELESDASEELALKISPQPLIESGRYEMHMNMKNMRANKTTRCEEKENTELSDRVLQWLDLAGKVDLLAPENVERMAQPRHSWPELQRKHNLLKSKTTIDVRAKEPVKIPSPKPCDSPKAQQNSYIDRQEFYVPTSANTIENYARQSRNVKITPRNDIQQKQRDNTAKTKAKELKSNVVEARQKVANEKTAVEKQYADMINKKLIPDVSKTAKKQVHIFMPDVPKKTIAQTVSTATSRTESILSHLSQKCLK